jgi:hypothetical protein
LGSNARPEIVNIDGLQNSSDVNPAGDQVSVSTRQTYSGDDGIINGLAGSTPELVSKSGDATSADVSRLAQRGGGRLAAMAFAAVIAAGIQWSDGGCVRIVAPAPSAVKPKATSKISVRTEGKLSHESFSAPVDLTLSGADKIDKQKLTSENTVTWTAGGSGTKATLTLTTKSRRGGATLEMPLKVEAKSYNASGGAGDFMGYGRICDISARFQISGDGVLMEFFPGGPDGGTYSYSGSIGGVGVSGDGNYSVTYAGDTAVAIDAGGPGTAGGYSNDGTEHYALTPLETSC